MANIMIDPETGYSHLGGSSLSDMETMCGNALTSIDYEYTTGTPTCAGCIDAAKMLLKNATAKEIKSW